jgi:histone-lysine N-methyltransferase SETD3
MMNRNVNTRRTALQRANPEISQDKFDRFEAWLRENGARFDQVRNSYHLNIFFNTGLSSSTILPKSSYMISKLVVFCAVLRYFVPNIYIFFQLELRTYDSTSNLMIRVDQDDDGDHGEEKKEPLNITVNNGEEEEVDSEMRGVHAKSYIPPHTVCMSIPRKCLITVEMGQATPIGHAIMNSVLDLDAPKHIFLMIYILWDRKVNGPKSFFWPYYEILPKTLSNMPIFWSPSELDELTGSYLLHQIADRSAAIAEDYASICQIAPLTSICTLQEFQWARMCVCSRNFGLCIDGHRTSAMVPHADMLNHYRPRATKWTFDETTQAFTITTLQGIHAGEEVLDSYGQKCNHRFLLNYGFAIEDNREPDGFCPNEVPLELNVDHSDPDFALKQEFWIRGEQQLEETTKRIRVCVSNNENTRLLFSFLRTLACNNDELRSLALPVMHSYGSDRLFGSTVAPTYHRSCRDIRHPISLRNERAAMKLLLDVVQHHLYRYPTTLAQDELDLKNEAEYTKFSNRRHAKIQVRGEKEVLHHFKRWAQTSLEVLDVIEYELNADAQNNSSVEVRLRQRAEGSISSPIQSFDAIIRQLEENEDISYHHTIVRYCADVLGSLRREEFKYIHRSVPPTRVSHNNSRVTNSYRHGRGSYL